MAVGEQVGDEEDKYLLEINLSDLENSTGEDELYWLLAIETAKESRRIRLREEAARVGVTDERRA